MHILISRFPVASVLAGTENFTLNLAKGLRAQGHTVTYIGNCPVLHKIFPENGFKTIPFWLPKDPVTPKTLLMYTLLFPYIWFLKRKFLQLAKEFDAFYMLTYSEKILVTKDLHNQGKKVIWGQHDPIDPEGKVRKIFTYHPFLSVLRRSSGLTKVVAVSEDTKKGFENLGGIQNLSVIPNGIDTDYFSPSFTEKYLEKKDSFVIGTVGRLVENKGIKEFLMIAKNLSQKDKKLHFVLCGVGELEDYVRNFIQENQLHNQFTFIPGVGLDRIRQVYNSFDLTVFLSKQPDPFGLVVAESMAMKKPTLVSKNFGLLNFDTQNQVTKIDVQNPESIEAMIQDIAVNPEKARQIAEREYEFVKNNCSYLQMANRYLKLLD